MDEIECVCKHKTGNNTTREGQNALSEITTIRHHINMQNVMVKHEHITRTLQRNIIVNINEEVWHAIHVRKRLLKATEGHDGTAPLPEGDSRDKSNGYRIVVAEFCCSSGRVSTDSFECAEPVHMPHSCRKTQGGEGGTRERGWKLQR